MKQQLLDQIMEDYINGYICSVCSDGKASMEIIKDLVGLLEDDAVIDFANMYDYNLEQEATQ